MNHEVFKFAESAEFEKGFNDFNPRIEDEIQPPQYAFQNDS
jgi:hypothetical protein